MAGLSLTDVDRMVRSQEAAAPAEVIHLVVADDQSLFRETLGRMLSSQHGMVVVSEAGDGEEAVRVAMALRPDVVLMDIGLPIMDGVEATRRIKASTTDVRVIAVTAHYGDDVFARALAAGVDSFVLKDARLDDLVASIRLTIAGYRVLNGPLLGNFTRTRQPESPYGLTPRELQMIAGLASGQSNRTLAARLGIREKTVRNHVSNIYAKLSVSSRAEAMILAGQLGLTGEGSSLIPLRDRNGLRPG